MYKLKQLKCEMCGSTDLLKQEGVFVCQNCGVKYSVEDAKKMMFEGTVDIQGVVKIDSSDELKKLYQAARNARETSDYATALRHYENISSRDPDSWEALFYLVILKTNSIKNGEIGSSALNVTNCLNRVFQLIKTNVTEDDERKKCVKEVIDQCYETALGLSIASQSFYKSLTKGNGLMALTGIIGAASSLGSTANALVENQTRYAFISDIMSTCGNEIECNFSLEDNDYKEYAVSSWKHMLEFDAMYKNMHGSHIFKYTKLKKYVDKIKEYEPECALIQEYQEYIQKKEKTKISMFKTSGIMDIPKRNK